MRRKFWILPLMIILISACEDVIHPSLPAADPVVVVDAWVNNKPVIQKIGLYHTLTYFDASPLPGISGAEVSIAGNDGSYYVFNESDSSGIYEWNPLLADSTFGKPGVTYILSIETGSVTYSAGCEMGSVPPIDSIVFKFTEGNEFMADSYTGQFYATDIPGYGNTYWIRAYKNGKYLNKPSEINLAFDAGFSLGSVVDGIQFVQPIRQGINPYDQDDNDKVLPSYLPGDSVYVEINSISFEAFDFLSQVATQTNRPGGFGELFAQPFANVPTNIVSSDPGKPAIGFFNVGSVSGLGKTVVAEDKDQ
jgi:hypothetical protein